MTLFLEYNRRCVLSAIVQIYMFLQLSVEANPASKNFSSNKFRLIHLKNGMNVLLFSRRLKLPYQGACLTVNAGYFDDPDSHLGLAHMHEHVLTQSSYKYPELNTLTASINVEFNAYTTNQQTSYIFTTMSSQFYKALEIFAQYFVSPLFRKDYLQQELTAVHNEYVISLSDYESRVIMLVKHVSSPGHPFHRLYIGNMDTLYKKDLREQLVRFHQEKYSANLMNLVVFGIDDYDSMQKQIEYIFSRIPNRNLKRTIFNKTLPFTNRLKRIVIFRPVNPMDTLTVLWQLPSLNAYPDKAVGDFILRYLNHQGDGSIFRYLQMHNLACMTTARINGSDTFSLLYLQVYLTEAGFREIGTVIKVVFDFLDPFKKTTKHAMENYWDDFIYVASTKYKYTTTSLHDFIYELSLSMGKAENSSHNILNLPTKFVFNFTLIKTILNVLTPNNSLILIGTMNGNVSTKPRVNSDFKEVHTVTEWSNVTTVPIPMLDFIEPYHSTPFTIYEIPPDLLRYWSSPSRNSNLHVAHQNPYILWSIQRNRTMQSLNPTLLTDNPEMKVWIGPDKSGITTMSVQCELKPRHTVQSSVKEAIARLYLKLVEFKLGSSQFAAQEVGYQFSFKFNSRSAEVQLKGHPDRFVITSLISEMLNTLLNVDDVLRDEKAFQWVMESMKQNLNSIKFDNVQSYIYSYLVKLVLVRPTWTNEELVAILERLTLSRVLDYGESRLLRDINVVCLFQNYDPRSVRLLEKKIHQLVSPRMSFEPIGSKGYPTFTISLEAGKAYGLSLPMINPKESNSFVFVMFQASKVCSPFKSATCFNSSLMELAFLVILENILKDSLATQLRSVEGLGYFMDDYFDMYDDVGTYQIVLQTEHFYPSHVLRSIDSVLRKFFEDTIVSSQFLDKFKSTKDELNKAPFSAWTSGVLWRHVMSDYHYMIHLDKQMSEIFDSLDVQTFSYYYYKLILNQDTRRKLTIVMYGEGKKTELDVDCIININQLDQTKTSAKSLCV